MQRITFVVVGKIKESFYRDAVAEYAKRLSRFTKLEIKELNEGVDPHCRRDEKAFFLQFFFRVFFLFFSFIQEKNIANHKHERKCGSDQ